MRCAGPRAHASPDVGVVGCRLVLPDGRLLHAGTFILPDTFWGQQIGALETDVNQYARTRDVEGIVFACAYVKRELLARIGGLSEKFRSYFEDTDYCLRAREAGFRTVVCGAVTLVHHEHGSTADDAEDVRGPLPGEPRDVSRPLGEEARGAVPARAVVAVDPELPNRLRHELPRDPARLDAEGIRAAYEYVYGPGTPFPVREDENAHDYLLNVISGRKSGRPAAACPSSTDRATSSSATRAAGASATR